MTKVFIALTNDSTFSVLCDSQGYAELLVAIVEDSNIVKVAWTA